MKKLTQILLALSLLFSPLLSAIPVSAATSISITSPSNGSTASGSSFTVTGTATPDRKITVKVNGSTVGATTSDGSGNWNLNVTGQSAGAKTVEATASVQYGYVFKTATGTVQAINTVTDEIVGSPISYGVNQGVASMSPNGNQMVSAQGFGSGSAIKVWSLANPEAPVISHNLTSVEDYALSVQYTADGSYFYVGSIASDFSSSSLVRYSSVDPSASPVAVTGYDQGGPTGLALNADGSRLYVQNELGDGANATVAVVNTATNTQLSTFAIGAQGAGTSIFTGPDNSKGFGIRNAGSTVIPINFSAGTVGGSISVATSPVGGTFNADGSKFLVTSLGGNAISTIDVTTNTVIDTTTIANPAAIVFIADYSKLYITQPTSNNVAVLNGDTLATIDSIPIGNVPGLMVIAPPETASTSVGFTLASTTSAASTEGLADTGDNTLVTFLGGMLLVISGMLGVMFITNTTRF